jgi:hypothetical protein
VDHPNEDSLSGDMQSHVLPVTSNAGRSARTVSTLSDLYNVVHSSRPRERTNVQPVPLHLAAELAREGTRESATQHCTAPPGQLHQFGVAWTLPLVFVNFPERCFIALLDTGALPTICKAEALRLIDPDFESKLIPSKTRQLKGLGGSAQVMGVYSSAVILPNVEGNLILERVEFLVVSCHSLSFDFIVGQDTQEVYRFQLNHPARKNAVLRIGTHRQSWFLSGTVHPEYQELIDRGRHLLQNEAIRPCNSRPLNDLHLGTVKATLSMSLDPSDLPSHSVAEQFPSGDSKITFELFEKVMNEPLPRGEARFMDALDEAQINPDLTSSQRDCVRKVLTFFSDAFILEGDSEERAQLGEPLKIVANIPQPIPKALKKACYPCSHQKEADMRAAVNRFQVSNTVQASTSPLAAATFMLYRGTKVRMIHDYRPINEYIKCPANPIPHLWTEVNKIGESSFFSSFDIQDAFYCMKLEPESRKFTAFSTPFGLFEYLTGCLGISCMPPEFQRRVQAIFHDPILQKWLKAYIDDCLVHAKSFGDALWFLFVSMSILVNHGIRVSFKKCWWMYSSIKYVGYKLNGLTIAIGDGRVRAILDWSRPGSKLDVQRLLGFLGYHRQFIKNYAQIVGPLQALVPLKADWQWTDVEEAAFEASKQALVDAVELHYPRFNEPFEAHTDASIQGLGAGLYQHQDGKLVPLAFISRLLRDAEHRYGATQLECLCVVWALEKYHFYIDGQDVTIVTDCIALRSLLTARWVNRLMLRWQVAIMEHRGHLTFIHRAGKSNLAADALSRHPLPNDTTNPAAHLDPDDTLEIGGITFVINGQRFDVPESIPRARTPASSRESEEPTVNKTDEFDALDVAMLRAEQNELFPAVDITDELSIGFVDVDPLSSVNAISTSSIAIDLHNAICKAYKDDPVYSTLLQALQKQDLSLLSKDLPALVQQHAAKGRFFILEGLIYHSQGLSSRVLIIDSPTRIILLDAAHDEPLAGHYGADKTWERLRGIAFWPGMRETIHDYCSSCEVCLHAKRMTGKPFGLLQRIELPKRPWQMINLDFVTGLPPAGPRSCDAILVVVDRWSHRVKFIPCHKTTDARETALLFVQYVTSQHGKPDVMISDRDGRFTSEFWKSLHQILDVRLAMSTAYNPQTDGLAERNIQTIEEALRSFCAFGHVQDRDGLYLDWYYMIFMLEYAYNSSVHAATGVTPFELDIGYIPNSSFDRIAERLSVPQLPHSSKSYASHLTRIHEHAKESVQRAHENAARRWDKKHQPSVLEPGDWALLSTKNYRFTGLSNKLKPAFVGPFLVIDKVGPNAVRLHLTPPFHRKHPVMPVSSLRKDTSKTPDPRFASRRQHEIPQPYATLEGQVHKAEEIQSILDERVRRDPDTGKSVREYLVQWKRYSNNLWIIDSLLQKEKAMEDLFRAYRQQRREDDRSLDDLTRLLPEPAPVEDAPTKDESETFEPRGNKSKWSVSRIVDERPHPDYSDGRVQYRIRWTGFAPSDDTWEDASTIEEDIPDLVNSWRQSRLPSRRSRRLQDRTSSTTVNL